MIRTTSISILLLLLTLFTRAQDYELLHDLYEPFDRFSTDNLGNFYLINGDRIQKWDEKAHLTYSYSNKQLGAITDVDLTNALKPLLFYRSTSSIVVLDNTLSVQGEPVDLDPKGLDQASLACTSVNNHFWFFDDSNYELTRMDRSFRETQTTGNLARILGYRIDPVQMLEYDNKLYINDKTNGILVFDIFGTYLKTIPLKNVEEFQVKDDGIYFFRNKAFHYYDPLNLETKTFVLPISSPDKTRIQGDKLFITKNNRIRIYSFSEPTFKQP